MNDVKTIAEQLVAAGAVMQLPGDPELKLLVGAFAWLDGHRVFWFTANGDSEFDGHVLEFEKYGLEGTVAKDWVGISFFKDETCVGYLTTIDEANLEDPAAYAADWEAWKKNAASRAGFIAEVKQQLTGGN